MDINVSSSLSGSYETNEDTKLHNLYHINKSQLYTGIITEYIIPNMKGKDLSYDASN